MSTAAAPGIVRTKVPARLDRLPWSRFHWRIVSGLGIAINGSYRVGSAAGAIAALVLVDTSI
jgi:hypothetical protein